MSDDISNIPLKICSEFVICTCPRTSPGALIFLYTNEQFRSAALLFNILYVFISSVEFLILYNVPFIYIIKAGSSSVSDDKSEYVSCSSESSYNDSNPTSKDILVLRFSNVSPNFNVVYISAHYNHKIVMGDFNT